MWRLSIVPTEGTGLTGADVVVHAEPGARVVDLAGVLAEHLGGGGRRRAAAPGPASWTARCGRPTGGCPTAACARVTCSR